MFPIEIGNFPILLAYHIHFTGTIISIVSGFIRKFSGIIKISILAYLKVTEI